MNSAIANLFFKQATCPSSETLLAYGAAALATAKSRCIAEHLATCEFCDAELRLLEEHFPTEREECPITTIPLDLRCLAEALLNRNSQSMESLSGVIYEKEGLSLTDA
ncbi:MAG TPA: hypothetical protein VGO91_09965 [Pyrinomonadaceae bacterium]|jgi:hypothetical protein|nr:hypothetical protein [Pyrinomonadaceae bacterium]